MSGCNTLILSLLFGSGGEHCDLALAVGREGEEEEEKEEEEEEEGEEGGEGGGGGTADIKSNNRHLTAVGKKHDFKPCAKSSSGLITKGMKEQFGDLYTMYLPIICIITEKLNKYICLYIYTDLKIYEQVF